MRLNEVINRFALVSGLEPCEVSKWTPLCIDAMNEIKSMAKKDAEKSAENSLRLSNLAGVLAYYKYSMYAVGDVKSFTAGSVSVTAADDIIERAEKLWKTERRSLSDLLTPEGFYFGRMRV